MFSVDKYVRYETPLENSYIPRKKNIWPAVIAAVGAIAGSLLNNKSTSDANKSNQKINERQIEASEKRLKDEQEYNNFLLNNQKQMQMSDAKAAGMNPAFAQGSLTGGMSSSPSVPVPSQIPMQATDWSGLGAVGNNVSNALLQSAQVDKTKAEEGLIKAQEVNQIIANKYADRLYKGNADFVESNVQVNGENVKYTKKQSEKISTEIMSINKSMEQSDAQIAMIKQQTAVLTEEQKIKFQEALFADKSLNDRLEQIRIQNKLTKEQINNIKQMTIAQVANLNAQTQKTKADTGLVEQQTKTEAERTNLVGAQVENTQQQTTESKANVDLKKQQTKTEKHRTSEVYWNANSNKLHFKLDEKYSDAERTVGIAKATAETVEATANAASSVIEAINPLP